MEFTKYKPNDQGAHSMYYNLGDGTGMKIIGAQQEYGLPCEADLLASMEWRGAMKEADMLIRCEHSGMTPKFISLKPVKFLGKFYPAIVMTHLEGVMLKELPGVNPEMDHEIKNRAKNQLLFHGIDHDDLNWGNILVNGEKLNVVDMDPNYVTVFDKSVKFGENEPPKGIRRLIHRLGNALFMGGYSS